MSIKLINVRNFSFAPLSVFPFQFGFAQYKKEFAGMAVQLTIWLLFDCGHPPLMTVITVLKIRPRKNVVWT